MAETGTTSRTRVKICGITRPGDGLAAAELGADAIGLVFHPSSPRVLDIEQARAVVTALPPLVCKVALFVDPDPGYVNQVLQSITLDLLQFHGDETAAECSRYGVPYIKAAHVQPGFDLDEVTSRYPDACGILLDAYVPDRRGGTGITFDWSLIPAVRTKPLILAGGLRPGNVADAIRAVRPYAVDVSGGVEADKGIKDPARMAAFIHEVKHA